MVLESGKRLDGRTSTQVRPIWSEIDCLPAPHGASIFNRGETQSLTTVTLGTKDDEMMVDTALELYDEKFFLHYNFPPFSVGEAKPMRGPGRREVGHANLAGRSLRKVMPKDFPYTVRIVSDILESNGSSSMATVCAGSLALMDAGVPIKAAASGIAMGMIAEDGKFAILSDILGDEDALGDMDFKITGTRKGICGTQMDMKIDGLSYELLEQALLQAKEGRIHILDKMDETISAPKSDFKPHAPRIVEMIIEKSFIGPVIGPGGKIIQEMQAKTGTKINIEEVGDKGVINIASNNKEAIEAAVAMIRAITFVPQVGDVFDAKVVTIMPFGAFVDFYGKSGLVHISEITHARLEKVEDALKVGDSIKVKLIGTDPKTGKLRLSRKVLYNKDGSLIEASN
jgi:polyribonucleotide nucleotidyltransferase